MDVAATVAAKASLAVLGDSWDVEDGGANDHYSGTPALRRPSRMGSRPAR
jgi:hypothetical protein